jgi:hypothetical protein
MKTIDISEGTKQKLEQLARRDQRAVSEVLDELVSRALPAPDRQRSGLRELARLGIKMPRDFATRLDDYQYGQGSCNDRPG